MAIFNGQLKANLVFATQFNQVISQQVYGTGVGDLSGIYESRKVDGTLYGDTKLYTSVDALKSYVFDGSDTGYNLLSIKRPDAPVTSAIVIDTFRQIPVTVDEYFTKQMWMGESAFSDFNGVILSWMTKTKEVYEHTKYTTDIVVSGLSNATSLGAIALAAPSNIAGYDLLRWRAQELYRVLEDMIAELSEPTRAFNDYGFLRNYKLEDFEIIMPLGILSSVRKQDLPFLFNPDSKIAIKEIHWKYFGTMNASASTTAATNTLVRAAIEADFGSEHLFPGDLLPNSTAYAANSTYTASYSARPTLNAATTILLVHKNDYPIMSAFSVGTSFFNARRLDMNHYLTFGHNNVQAAHIGEYALLKVTTTVA